MGFHILNRGVAPMQLFEKTADYHAFKAGCGNARPIADADLCLLVDAEPLASAVLAGARGRIARFMQRLTITHVRRRRERGDMRGWGHIDQGRYQSFPVESDEHFWVVAGYVSAIGLRAQLVLRAEEWRWSSLWRHVHGTAEAGFLLATWPIDGRRTGSSGSIGPTTRESWSRSAKACTESATLVGRSGKSRSRNDWASSRLLSSEWSTAEDEPFESATVDRLESPPRD